MFDIKLKMKKGVTLYFAIVVMSVIFSIGIGLSLLIFTQIKITKEIGDSVVALYAADSGIEEALYKLYKEEATLPFNFSENIGEASLEVRAFSSGNPECPSPPNGYYCIKSIGKYRKTQRAIEISQ